MLPTYEHGWFQIAFERDLNATLTATEVGQRRLLIVRTEDSVRVFDADCPHRGAHLACGGKLVKESVLCPFHGFMVGLGKDPGSGYHVREYPSLTRQGLVFVRLSDEQENGFSAHLDSILQTHVVVPGYILSIRAPASVVIENGFDVAHFRTVHRVDGKSHGTRIESEGCLRLDGQLTLQARFGLADGFESQGEGASGRQKTEIPFVLRAYSPGLSILDAAGDYPYVMIVGATPTPEGHCHLRLSLALCRDVYGDPPNPHSVEHLLRNSKIGIQDDQKIWENLAPSMTPRFTEHDAAVEAFRDYGTRFAVSESP